ncbi:MAG: nitroreductase family protein [Actinomycetaceae bacterium]|nr:nitroreductase family protein [Actinomycetaceae bacterium]
MNTPTIEHQLNHRSIRQFSNRPVDQQTLDRLREVARRTPSSNNIQSSAIIRVKDPAVRSTLADIANQAYIKDAPEVWVMIVDCHRLQGIVEERGADADEADGADGAASMDLFFQGFTDACLMGQNIVNAAESLGLGTCYLGSLLNDCPGVIEALKLPALTFPVFGLMIGWPGQEPALKPRMDMGLRFFEDSYQRPDSYVEALSEHDTALASYYDLRDVSKPVPAYTAQVVARMGLSIGSRRQILRAVRSQGFNLALE